MEQKSDTAQYSGRLYILKVKGSEEDRQSNSHIYLLFLSYYYCSKAFSRTSSLILIQWFSAGGDIFPQGKFDNVWRQF